MSAPAPSPLPELRTSEKDSESAAVQGFLATVRGEWLEMQKLGSRPLQTRLLLAQMIGGKLQQSPTWRDSSPSEYAALIDLARAIRDGEAETSYAAETRILRHEVLPNPVALPQTTAWVRSFTAGILHVSADRKPLVTYHGVHVGLEGAGAVQSMALKLNDNRHGLTVTNMANRFCVALRTAAGNVPGATLMSQMELGIRANSHLPLTIPSDTIHHGGMTALLDLQQSFGEQITPEIAAAIRATHRL